MAEKQEKAPVEETQAPKKRRSCARSGCFGCLGLVVLLALVLVVAPFVLSRISIFGQSAKDAYSGAPDLQAGATVHDVFEEQQITGVRVYVMPVKGKTTNQAFIILDANQGYQGLSPTNQSDAVFSQVLQNLVTRNRDEELHLERVTVEHKDEQGKRTVAFTTSMDNIEALVDGRMSQDQFFGQVYFDIVDTLGNFGINVGEVLQGLQGQ